MNKDNVKKIMKLTAGVCAALGIVAVGAVVASGAAVKVVADGLKAAKDTMRDTIWELKKDNHTEVEAVEETAPRAPAENTEAVTEADFAETPEITAET